MWLLLLSLIQYFGNSVTVYIESYIGNDKGWIQSAGFPFVRPVGSSATSHHLISSPDSRIIQLVFDDFLSVCSEKNCENKDLLKVYDGKNSSFPLLGEFHFSKNERPPALVSSGSSLLFEYVVTATSKTYEFLGFNASFTFRYKMQKINVQTFTISAKNQEDPVNFAINGNDGEFDGLWLIKAGEMKLQNLQIHLKPKTSSYSIINVFVRLGLTSNATLLTTRSWHFADSIEKNIFFESSKHEYIYLRLTSLSLSKDENAILSFYLNKEQLGCEGIFCANGGTCQVYEKEFYCHCAIGYSGSRCRSSSSCSNFVCENGGTCRDTIHVIPFCLCTHEYSGRHCEIRTSTDDSALAEECPQNYCFNGGTCFHTKHGYYCACPPQYSGEFCISVRVDDTSNVVSFNNNSKKQQYLLTVIIPISLIIIIYMVYKFKRKSWTNGSQNPNVNSRNQLYNDCPPSYEQAMTRPVSLTVSQETEAMEPPPKYEDVVIVTETNCSLADCHTQAENVQRQSNNKPL